MRYLLDSHVFLWWVQADTRLTHRSIETLRRSREVYVSVASIWELALKLAKGKLQEERSLLALTEEFRFRLLAVQPEHAEAAASIPAHHCDPFDHMLLAQAKAEGLTLVTHDSALLRYAVPILLV